MLGLAGCASAPPPPALPSQAIDLAPFIRLTRDPVAPLLWGQQRAVTLKVNASVGGSFVASDALLTLSYESNRKSGESWARTVYHAAERHPRFLVKQDGTNSVAVSHFELLSSDAHTSGVSSLAVTAVTAVLEIAQATMPQSTVVTSLSSDAIKQRASAVDAQLGKLFGSQLAENHWLERA